MKKSKIVILCLLVLAVLALLASAIILLAGRDADVPEQTTAETQPTETRPTETQQPVQQDPELTRRREIAEEEMRRTMSTPFVYDEDVTYPIMAGSKLLNLQAGEIYYGLPYTNGSGSGDAFFRNAVADENGVYHVTGFDGYLLGNDCADAIFWAWARVSNTITFRGTQEMTEKHGCLKVGQYVNNHDINEDTQQVCEENGEQVMYAAYALLQLADAVVERYDGSGHALMIAETVTVYAEDGTIDGNESYVIYHEQSMPCAVDQKFTFKMLYLQGYLPVTVQELIDAGEPVEETVVTDSIEQTALNADNMLTGTITANYRMSDVLLEIKDSSGEVLQSARRYVNEEEMYAFSMEHFQFGTHLWNYDFKADIYRDFIDLTVLDSGTYTCTVSVLLSTGQTHTVRNYEFTV